MFKKQLNPNNVILFCICVLLLIGCQPTTNQDNETIFTTRIIANEPETAHLNTIIITPTRSISQTTISTRTPILLPTSSATPQPTPTALPTETPTPTSWPTLSPDDAANKLLSLLADNQNPDCLLPCWWGATPGQTLWQDIEPFLTSLVSEIHYSSSETSFGAEVILPLPESVAVINSSNYHAFYGWDGFGVIHSIAIDSMNISGYDPATMMTLYGVPDEVWLMSMTPRDIAPFHLILVYQALGFSLHYYVNATTTYETYTACFSDEIESVMPETFPAGPKIRAWVPGQHQPIYNIVNIPWEQFYPLEEVTNLTPQTVYDTFVTAETPCIHTPAQFWEGK